MQTHEKIKDAKIYFEADMLSFVRPSIAIHRRAFSVILSTGEKVEREMTSAEREVVNMKEYQFSKLGLYKKDITNVATLYKLFQLALPKVKSDYSACLYAVNHFYNFGVPIDHHELGSRWLATAVETGRVDEAVELVKYWHTFLRNPPALDLIELLVGMVGIEQSRELLKSIRENWNIPLSAYAYSTLISKEIGVRFSDPESVREAFVVWEDAWRMSVLLPAEVSRLLVDALLVKNMSEEANVVLNQLSRENVGRHLYGG